MQTKVLDLSNVNDSNGNKSIGQDNYKDLNNTSTKYISEDLPSENMKNSKAKLNNPKNEKNLTDEGEVDKISKSEVYHGP